LAANPPAPAPAAPATPPHAYGQDYATFSAMMPPDPNTFLKLIWPILTKHQQQLIQALVTPPDQMAAGGPSAAPASAPVAPPASSPTPA